MSDWQICESSLHEGDEHDATVEWRELGLLCDACYAAIDDMRRVKAENERLRELYANAVAIKERGWSIDHLMECDEALRTVETYAERLRAAIEAHKERWTSVNSGDIQQNARPADLELWEALDA